LAGRTPRTPGTPGTTDRTITTRSTCRRTQIRRSVIPITAITTHAPFASGPAISTGATHTTKTLRAISRTMTGRTTIAPSTTGTARTTGLTGATSSPGRRPRRRRAIGALITGRAHPTGHPVEATTAHTTIAAITTDTLSTIKTTSGT
jgi:hypothetical protein